MKFTCLREKLAWALSILERVVSRTTTLPILQHILLETQKGRLKLTATDLELAISCWVSAKVEHEGKATVPAKLFTPFVSHLIADRVTVTQKKTETTLEAAQASATFHGLNPEDFPIVPKVAGNRAKRDLSSADLFTGLRRVSVAAAFSETRPEISGVHIHVPQSKELTFVATDSFRLSRQILAGTSRKAEGFPSVTIPLKTVFELLRILPRIQGDVVTLFDETQARFELPDVHIVSRLIDGQFPDYERIIPVAFETEAIVKREDLDGALRLSSVFVSKLNDAAFHLTAPKDFSILARSPELGEERAELDAEVKGKPLDIVFNWRFMADGVSLIEAERVHLGFNGSDRPAILRAEGQPNFLYLVMPIKNVP